VAAAATIAITLGAAGAQAAAGALDSNFGTGGVVLSDLGSSSDDSAYALAIQADGKIVTAGESTAGGSDDFAIARYKKDGTLQSGFGTGGVVFSDLNSGSDDTPYALAIQPDGKIVTAGESDAGSGRDFALARYKSDGTVNSSFGSGGFVINDLGSSSDDSAYAVTVDNAGKILAAGRSDANGSYDFAIARYKKNGSPDTGFGTGGVVLDDLGTASNDVVRGIAIVGDGKILTAGYSNANGSFDFALARYKSDGSPDTGFGTGGVVLTDLGSGSGDVIRAVAIQADGKIVVAGYSDANGSYDFALARYKKNGILDTGFGTGGVVLTDLGTSSVDTALAVAIQSDGKILLAGDSNANGSFDFALVRYLKDGTPDSGFGTGGVVLSDLGTSSDDNARAVAVQGSGKIVLAGESDANVSSDDFALARYKAT
jgi:uncharacterized delta-60 repeat protein